MFRGGAAHSLDDKGRVIIPQKFRLLLGEKFIITKGLDKCLWVFTDEEYRRLAERLKAQPMLDQSTLLLQRFFSASAVDSTADGQGRVAIPPNLREYAAIDKEVMIVGAETRLEIWNKQRWDELEAAMTDDQIRESAREVGIG